MKDSQPSSSQLRRDSQDRPPSSTRLPRLTRSREGLRGPRGLGPRPRSPVGLLGRPGLGLRRTRSREGLPGRPGRGLSPRRWDGLPGSTLLLLRTRSREDLAVSSQVRFLPPRPEELPSQPGTPHDLLPRVQVN